MINLKQLLLHFILSTLLLLFLPITGHQHFSSPLYSYSKELKIIQNTHDISYSHLLIAYVTGEKTYLPKSIKHIHQRYYLSHLFTPSALHFTIFLSLISPLLIGRKVKIIFYLLISITASPLFSIARVATYKLFKELSSLKLSNYSIFLLASFLHLTVGTFNASPKSFFYSFLFFGAITTIRIYSFTSISMVLLLAQILLCSLTSSQFNPIHFMIGFTYSTLFGPMFILSFIYYLLPIKLLTPFIILTFKLQYYIFHHLPVVPLSFSPPLIMTVITYVLTVRYYYSVNHLIVFILLLYTEPILNFPSVKYLRPIYRTSKRIVLDNLKYRTYGYYSRNKKRECFHRIYSYQMSVFCKKKGKIPLPPISHTPRHLIKNSVQTE